MIALFRFQIAGYLRSLRVLYPLIIVALLLVVVLAQGPSGPRAAELATGGLADVAAFLLPIGAWATRGLLDTQPDVQRELSALSVGGRHTPVLAGLLAGYAVNLCLAALLLALPLVQALAVGLEAPAVLAGIALSALVAAAATVLGAWTSRAVIRSAATSILVLLGACLAVLLLGMGPLSPLSLPMIGWLRAGHHGPGTFVTAFPAVAVHVALWTAAVGLGYVLVRRHRP